MSVLAEIPDYKVTGALTVVSRKRRKDLLEAEAKRGRSLIPS